MKRLSRPRFGTIVCCLLALGSGVGLYIVLPPAPLWTLEVHEELGGVAPDGGHFFTTATMLNGGHKRFGPLRLRECRTGREVKSYFTSGEHLQRPTVSRDGRFWAAIVEPDQVRVVDLQEQRTWSLPAPEVNAEYALHFAPDGTMVHVRAAHVKLPDRNFLFELPAGKLLAPPDEIRSADFSADGRFLVLWKKDGTHLWDRAGQQTVGDYLDQREGSFRFSPDGRRLLTSPEPGEKEPFRPILWDLATHQKVADLSVELLPDIGYRYVQASFAPNGRWLVTFHDHERDGRTLEVWDSATGKRLGRHDLNPKCERSLVIAPDSAGLVVVDWIDFGMRGSNGAFALTMLDMPAAEVRWQRTFEREQSRLLWSGPAAPPGIEPGDIRFTPDGGGLSIFVALRAEWRFLDAHTGQSRHTARLLDAGTNCFSIGQDPLPADRRRVLLRAAFFDMGPPWLPTWLERWLPRRVNHGTLHALLDGSNGSEIARLKLPGSIRGAAGDRHLITDSRLEAGGEAMHRLQGWTVPPGRAWRWIIGIPLAVGILLGALRQAWAWRRRRAAAVDARV